MNRHRTPAEPTADAWSEARLIALFAALPRLEPSAGFVDRVVAALPRRGWLDSPWGRGLLAAALVAVALSTALFVPAAFSLARLAGPATLLGLWVSAVGDLFTAVGESFAVWERLASFARALAVAFAQPKALALLAANVGLAFAAFRGLVAILPGRSSSHVALAS